MLRVVLFRTDLLCKETFGELHENHEDNEVEPNLSERT